MAWPTGSAAPTRSGFIASSASRRSIDQRHDVEIDEPVRRIKNFHVAAERAGRIARALSNRARARVHRARLPIDVFAVESEDFAGGVIQVGDAAVGIGDDDSFLDGIEDRLEKTFLLREAKQIILHLLRADAAEAADQFFEKAGFHLVRYCNRTAKRSQH